MPSNKILFATDYSDASQHALEFATSLARDRDATLLIVHVSEYERYPVGEPSEEEPPPSKAELDELKAVTPLDPAVSCAHQLLYGEAGSVEITKPAEVLVKVCAGAGRRRNRARDPRPLGIEPSSDGKCR